MNEVKQFSKEERERYSRHFVLPGFGEAEQYKLKNSSVAVVGAGGLGCPVLQYLVAAGVGSILIIDHDVVSLSNLQRQILYSVDDLNLPKATVGATKLSRLNPNVKITTYTSKIDASNALKLLEGFDVMVDCTDNFSTRYLLSDASVLLNIPLVYGSIFRYEGQVAVFNFNNGPTYRDLYPLPPLSDSVPSCEAGGVLGVLPGIIGSIQANEVIKIITGIGTTLSGKLLALDAATMETQIFQIPNKNQSKKIFGLIDYDDFCNTQKKTTHMKEVTVQELKSLIDSNANFQLIDVREPHEYDICNLEGEMIPQGEIPHNIDKIAKDKQVVIHCRSGARSSNMVKWLESNHGFTNLYNLKGGILAWAKEIDTSMPTY